MNVLVLYASTEGQTRKVAEHIASHVGAAGHRATVCNMGSERAIPDVAPFDAVICAASVHQGYHQESAIDFVSAKAGALNAKKSAFVSVSLSAALADGKLEAQSYVDRFLETTGWRPGMSLLLAGAVRLSDYDYFERQVLKYIVMQKGVAQDAVQGLDVDYECTDWQALEDFVDSFLGAGRRKDAPGKDVRPNA